MNIDVLIRKVAASQQGVVSRSQLTERGVSRHAIDYRLKKDRLRPLHRGVYLVGPIPGPYYRETAAVLACGDRAVLCRRSAASLWGFWSRPGSGESIEVAGPRSLRGPREGVRVYRVGTTAKEEVARKYGLPVTTPERTVLDLASAVGERALEQALAKALRSGVVSTGSIGALLDRNRHRPGVPLLRHLLAAESGPELTRSEAEERFRDLVTKADLPKPRLNHRVAGMEVDFFWPDQGLIVEIDGFGFHNHRDAFEDDRDRDAILVSAGYRVIRFTWRRLTEHREALLVRLAQSLVVQPRQRSQGPR